MEENEVVEQEVEETEADFDVFDDTWDEDNEAEGVLSDHDDDDTDTEEATPADEPENAVEEHEAEQAEETAETSEKPGEPSQEGNQLFEINYLGNKEQLTLEQMTELAQKGRDYDHVRQERDTLKSESGRQLAFLKELADRAGLTVDEQIDRTRALWLQNEEFDKGNELSEAEALLRVQRDKGKPVTAETQQDDGVPEGFNAQIDRFRMVYPDVMGDDIPKEVWELTAKMGGDLLGAYQAHMINELKAENAKKSQEDINTKNKARSTGPLQNAGAGKQVDPFDEGWDS